MNTVTRNANNDLRKYTSIVLRNKNQIYCDLCKTPLLCRNYQKHLEEMHRERFLNSNSCPWCLGEVSWSGGKKCLHVDHLKFCYKRYWRSHRLKTLLSSSSSSRIPVEGVDDFILDDSYIVRQIVSSELPILDLHGFADETLYSAVPYWWHCIQPPNELTFNDVNDQHAIECIKKFDYAMRDDTSSVRFYHLMVRLSTWPSFCEHMDAYGSGAFLLPYSCLCNGGREEHRHMICVARDGQHFLEQCWNKIRGGLSRVKGYKSKKRVSIETWFHLKNTIVYVSTPKERCRLYKKRESWGYHYYIMRHLTKYFSWMAALSMEGGITKQLNQMYGQKPVSELMDYCVWHTDRYGVKIKHLFPEMNIVLNVARKWKCVSEETDAYLHLGRDQKLYFKLDEAPFTNDDEWKVKQGLSGNCFMKAIGEKTWYPLNHQQKLLKSIHKIKSECKSEISMLKANSTSENVNLKSEVAKLNSENARLNSENATLNSENARLKSSLENSEERYKVRERCLLNEIKRLNGMLVDHFNEIKRLHGLLESSESKIQQLNDQIKNRYEYEIKLLTEQLNESKNEIKRLNDQLQESLKENKRLNKLMMRLKMNDDLKQM